MSGHGNREITGLRFSLGSLVAFTWRPEGFWVFQNDGLDPFKPRMDRLINRFENNNYPDREGMADELRADSRFEEKDRISTSDHLIKTWPPAERPVAPAFGVAATEKNQDPKEKEGKFSGKKITGTLKHKLPKNLASYELAYPEEVKTDWFIHEPEHLVYFPVEGVPVENRLDRMVQHYILVYSNELRPSAPFLTPLRGEYSPAQWIAEFCQKAEVLAHGSAEYPEDYVSGQQRIEKTRQFPLDIIGFEWWYGENLQFHPSINLNSASSQEEQAMVIARAVVDAWIDSPPHYANLIKNRDSWYQNLALLDIGRAGHYYSQVFMGAPHWLQAGNCTWQGNESWKVLSWNSIENHRYMPTINGYLYFKGRSIYFGNVLGACLHESNGKTYLLVFVKLDNGFQAMEAEFHPSKNYESYTADSDFTVIATHQFSEDYSIKGVYLQSFFASRDGKKAITLLYLYKPYEPYWGTRRQIVRYEDGAFSLEEVEGQGGNIVIHGAQHVDYSDQELILTVVRYESTNSLDMDYFLNGVLLPEASIRSNLTSSNPIPSYFYDWRDIPLSLIETPGRVLGTNHYAFTYPDLPLYTASVESSTYGEYSTGKWYTKNRFVDLRSKVFVVNSTLYVQDAAYPLPITDRLKIYTRQAIEGLYEYPIMANVGPWPKYYYENLLGVCFAEYEGSWVFSMRCHQVDEIIIPRNLSVQVVNYTTINHFVSSNPQVADHLNTLTKPFLVSVI